MWLHVSNLHSLERHICRQTLLTSQAMPFLSMAIYVYVLFKIHCKPVHNNINCTKLQMSVNI